MLIPPPSAITPVSLADLEQSQLDQLEAVEVAPSAPCPVPSAMFAPASAPTARYAVVSTDDRAVMGMIELILDRSGVSQAEICRRLGIRHQSLNQYRWLRRKRPSIQWVAKLAAACGARLVIEFPKATTR